MSVTIRAICERRLKLDRVHRSSRSEKLPSPTVWHHFHENGSSTKVEQHMVEGGRGEGVRGEGVREGDAGGGRE